MAKKEKSFSLEAQTKGLLKAVIVINSKVIVSTEIINRLANTEMSPKVVTISAHESESTDTSELYNSINTMQPIILNVIDMPLRSIKLIYAIEALGYTTSTIYLETNHGVLDNLNYDKYSLRGDLLAINCDAYNLTNKVLGIFSNRINSFFTDYSPIFDKIEEVFNAPGNEYIRYGEKIDLTTRFNENGQMCLVPAIYNEPYLRNTLRGMQENPFAT